ncbi:hypothetical protein ACFQZ4_00275 [Catellatospora coxensis]
MDWFEQMSAQVVARVAGTQGSRLVTTRHGDPMRLTDFQVTRVVELAVHGLDLADALGVAPWLTAQAAGVVEGLLFGLAAPRQPRSWAWTGPGCCAAPPGGHRCRPPSMPGCGNSASPG